MSRSYWKSTTNNSRFGSCVYYFSNKKSRREANQRFRTKNKHYLKILKTLLTTWVEYPDDECYNNIDKAETKLLNRLRECSDTWDFDSDGLKGYIERPNYTEEQWKRFNYTDAEWKKRYKCK